MNNVDNNNTYYHKPQIGLSALNAGIWGAGWGAGCYLWNKHPYLKNETCSDKFIKKIDTELENSSDPIIKKHKEETKKFLEQIENIQTEDDIKNFISKEKNKFGIEDEKIILDILDKSQENLSNKKASLKIIYKDKADTKFYVETLQKCLDSKDKFLHDSTKINKETFDIFKKVSTKFRQNKALINCAIVTGVIFICNCIQEFFIAKKSRKNS